jgi:pimeloyl-ACP methyl ester carboxylesterase
MSAQPDQPAVAMPETSASVCLAPSPVDRPPAFVDDCACADAPAAVETDSAALAPAVEAEQEAHPLPAATTEADCRPALAAVDTAEAALLALLSPGLAYDKRTVRLPRSGHALNTISAGDPHAPPLVLLHGWGAGCGFFARNIAPLAARHRVHAVDWLGFGASSRPPFDLAASPEDAEAFFLDALEEWCAEMAKIEHGLPPFHICGHSLGAFLAVGFALRCPHLVVSLVLASPVGVPTAPEVKAPPPAVPILKRVVMYIAFALWERQWTPQVFIRAAPEAVARALVSAIVAPRFPTTAAAEHEALAEYFYQLWRAPPSGEHSLSTILESGAFARRPLVDKLPLLRVPVLFLYGDRDWMDSAPAEKTRQAMTVPTKLLHVPSAGHHLYYDNPEHFNDAVLDACAAASGVKRRMTEG